MKEKAKPQKYYEIFRLVLRDASHVYQITLCTYNFYTTPEAKRQEKERKKSMFIRHLLDDTFFAEHTT